MRLMACFGVVVLLVILDSLSKALATAEESKRNQWLKDNIGGPPLDREIRWNGSPDSPKSFGRIPRTVKSFGRIPRGNLKSFGRVPRTFDDSDNANVDDKFLEEMSRRAWGARFMPGTKNIQGGKRSWDVEAY
ncbi:uncharacterized protein [Amphiura filiformis]|uniref:uncharacterized protein isoform X3 n=1 Tax=Amphiura filiformis TaxID=82378 RepID=UPI003B221C88